MRLLYLVREKFPSFRPDVTELFGTELPNNGMDVLAVMTSSSHCDHVRVARMGRSVVVVAPTCVHRALPNAVNKLFALLARYWVFLCLARRRRWDVVQSRDEIIGAWLVTLATLGRSARRCYWLSFPFPEEKLDAAMRAYGWRRWLLNLRGHIGIVLLYRSGMFRMDHLFVQSEQMRHDLVHFGLDPRRMTPVPMAVQLRGLLPVQRAPSPPAQLKIGYLGTLDAARRPGFMVDVLQHVRQHVPDAELLLVGDGMRPSDRAQIEDHARRCDLGHVVHITGFLPREQAWARLRECFVCLSPFFPTKILNSTSPTKLVEYLQLALPVVANDHPEQRLVIRDSGVGLCVPWDERAFAGAIVRMWCNAASTWQQAAAGPDFVRSCRSYEAVGRRVFQHYQEIVHGTPSRNA